MLTQSMRRSSGIALAVLAMVVIFSDVTMAQQTGLFPLAPIRRRRPNCDQQDPVYRLYKDQYFGYHPTLWRRFPSGWGAPSPEAPNAAASYEKLPLTTPDGESVDEVLKRQKEEDQDAQGQPGAAQPEVPAAPPEDTRSPFEMDAPPAGAEPSPFEKPGPRANAPAGPSLNAPDLAAPAPTRTSRYARPAEIDPADAGSPLLAAADAASRVDARDSGLQDVSGAIDAPAIGAPAEAEHNHAQQSAPKRGRIGTMISSMGWSSRRR